MTSIPARFVNDSGVTELEGTLELDDGAIVGPVTIDGAGQSLGTNLLNIVNADGDFVFYVDGKANVEIRFRDANAGFNVTGFASGTAFAVGADGTIQMPDLPAADPSVAGQLYTTANVVKVSTG